MAAGWLIGVLMDAPSDPGALRRFFVVARPDRAEAEWAAVDAATAVEPVATALRGGVEPVQAEGELPAGFLRANGVKPGTIRDLGDLRPRRWLDAVIVPERED